jgi:hypothetical protein
MNCFVHGRRLWAVAAAVLLLAGSSSAARPGQNAPGAPAQAGQSAPAQTEKPLPLKPDLPGVARNHRLILKDGTYQIVREYEIVGDRVRYFSQERAEWEELPVDLVNWDATRKWERDHASPNAEESSPAMKEAAEIDNEESAERADQNARMPKVAEGLELPDRDGALVLDTFQGTPELVDLASTDIDVDAKSRHGAGMLSPLAGARGGLELEGAHAKVHLHVNDPAFYLSLGVTDSTEPVLSHSMVVNTGNAKDAVNVPHGAHSVQSEFAIVGVDERQAVRLVGPIHVNQDGTVEQDGNVIPTQVEVMPGKRWLRVKPRQTLLIGDYALVEILSPAEMSPLVWDFRVDPATGDNPGSLGPILDQTDDR